MEQKPAQGPVINQPPSYQPPVTYSNQNVTIGQFTNIMAQQPMVGQSLIYENQRDWEAEFCDFCSDSSNCCYACCCADLFKLKIFNEANENACDCYCGSLSMLRTKVRVQRGIRGSLCEDVCASTWCPICVMIQISKELERQPTPKHRPL